MIKATVAVHYLATVCHGYGPSMTKDRSGARACETAELTHGG